MSRTINIEEINDYLLLSRANLLELQRAHRRLRWVLAQLDDQLDQQPQSVNKDRLLMDFFDLEDVQQRIADGLNNTIPMPDVRVACFIQPKPRVRAVS
jgi:hypothetical protein